MQDRVRRSLKALVAVVVPALLIGGCGGSQQPKAQPGRGRSIFVASCARCHGVDGEGRIGPKLTAGAVLERFPAEPDQVDFVERGRGLMPPFAKTLTAREIAAVVRYTRTALQR